MNISDISIETLKSLGLNYKHISDDYEICEYYSGRVHQTYMRDHSVTLHFGFIDGNFVYIDYLYSEDNPYDDYDYEESANITIDEIEDWDDIYYFLNENHIQGKAKEIIDLIKQMN